LQNGRSNSPRENGQRAQVPHLVHQLTN
jgi:hypothetical protein